MTATISCPATVALKASAILKVKQKLRTNHIVDKAMKANLIFLCLTIICMASCSSPKTDGVKLAQESCDNTESYIAKTIQAYNNFVKDFSDKGYKSRVEARTDLEKRLAEVQFSFKAKNDEIDDEYSQLLAKYEDDYRKVTEMVNAHKMIIDSYATDSTMFNTLSLYNSYRRSLTA